MTAEFDHAFFQQVSNEKEERCFAALKKYFLL